MGTDAPGWPLDPSTSWAYAALRAWAHGVAWLTSEVPEVRRRQGPTQARTQTFYPPEALLMLQTGYFSDCVLFYSLEL